MEPTQATFAFDFWDIWQYGLAVLRGQNPWALDGSFYPPATNYFLFAVFALLPMSTSFIVMTLASVSALVATTGRKALLLIFFLPITNVFAVGQIDLLFLPLIALLAKRGKWGLAAAVLITLKPQIALVVLPWYCVRWFLNDQRRLAYFVAGAMALHLAPLIINPHVFSQWFAIFGTAGDNKVAMTAGIWQLRGLLPFALLGAISALGAVVALTQENEKTARTIMAVTSPLLSYYDAAILWDCAPLPILLLSGIAALGLSHLTHSFLPMTLVAWTVMVYRLLQHRLTIPTLSGRISPRVERMI